MKKKTVNLIIKEAILASLYIVLTFIFNPISFGTIQFRISEVLILMCYYNKKHMIGLTVGVFIANLFSPMLLFDITFGVCASILSFICINRIRSLYIGAIFPVIINAIIVGMELYLSLSTSFPFIINALWVGLGELVVMIVGVISFKLLEKNKFIYERILVGEEQ